MTIWQKLRHLLAGCAVGIFVTAGDFGIAAPIPGPVAPSAFIATLNQYLMTWMGFSNQGELTLAGPNAFAPLGTVATAMSSLGPVGSNTTVQEWLVVINPAGTVRFVPAF